MDSVVKVSGIEALQKTFGKLPKSVQTKAMRPALKAGGNVLRDAAVTNLKAVLSGKSTGLAQKSLRVYSLKKYKGNMRVGVMVKRGLVYPARLEKGKPVRVGLAVSVLEYGKKDQPPRSWIRKAARESVNPVLQEVAAVAKKNMADAVEDAKK